MKKKWYWVVGIVIVLILISIFYKTQNFKAAQILSCESHSDCSPELFTDCGGELCAPEWNIFCDNGQCRTPTNYTEWEIACKETDNFSKSQCFEIATSIAKDKAGIEVAFNICNRNYELTDEAESCRLKVCGFNAAYPEIQPGEEACVKKTISSTCNDNRKNGRESDIDCGQFECEACENGKHCRSNMACKSGICNLNGIYYRDTCVPVCTDGSIKDNTPCGCGVQGYENKTVEDWETQYGNGKTLFCCNGVVKQLLPDQNCI